MQRMHKPGDYKNHKHFFEELYYRAPGCTRHYYLLWYDRLARGGYPLPAPFWDGPPVPGYNVTHDAFVKAWRTENGIKSPFE